MRRSFCTFFAAVATLWLALPSCSAPPPPASPGASAPPAAATSPEKTGARADDKADPRATKGGRTFAECPSIGDAVAPAGAPTKDKVRHEEIVATIQKHRDKFRCCYDAARQQNPSLKGSYTVEMIFKPEGTIKSVLPQKDRSEIHDQGMDDCAFTVAKTLIFSPHTDGKETTISMPFNFKPDGGGK